MQEVLADHLGGQEDEAVAGRHGVHADESDELLELGLAVEQPHGAAADVGPGFVNVGLRVVGDDVVVERVAGQPVDGWEVALGGESVVEAPEDLDDA